MHCYICGNKFDILVDSLNTKLYYCNNCFLIHKKGETALRSSNLSFVHNIETNSLVISRSRNDVYENDVLNLNTNFTNIYLENVIEYIYDLDNLINICKNSLSADGKIVLKTSDELHISNSYFIYKHFIDSDKISFFTTNTLRYLCSKNKLILNNNENTYEMYIMRCNVREKNISNKLLYEMDRGIYNIKMYKNYKVLYNLYKLILYLFIIKNMEEGFQITYLEKDKRYIKFLCDDNINLNLEIYNNNENGRKMLLVFNQNDLLINFKNVETLLCL